MYNQDQYEKESSDSLEKNQIEKNKKIHKKVLKKRPCIIRVERGICFLNYFQLSQVMIVNQNTLKYPQKSVQSFITNIFHFKRVSSIHVNQKFLELDLKKAQPSMLPIDYFIERYKSFGDCQFNRLSKLFSKIQKQYNYQSFSPANLQKQLYQNKYYQDSLNDFLNKMQNRLFITFFYLPSTKGLSLLKIIFSKNLIKTVGIDIQEIKDDFIKYKNPLLQIFGCDVYKQVVEKGTELIADTMEKCRLNIMDKDDIADSTTINMKSKIHRKFKSNGKIYEEEVEANIKFFKPTFYISVLEIQSFNELNVLKLYPPYNQVNRTSQIHFQQFAQFF